MKLPEPRCPLYVDVASKRGPRLLIVYWGHRRHIVVLECTALSAVEYIQYRYLTSITKFIHKKMKGSDLDWGARVASG